jgi:hypothetical protein
LGDQRLAPHLPVVERAMDLADLLRQHEIDDEDLKVVQMLGMRSFNALGAGLKLALSGYHQNSALILRDILETVFLLDLFNGDPASIGRGFPVASIKLVAGAGFEPTCLPLVSHRHRLRAHCWLLTYACRPETTAGMMQGHPLRPRRTAEGPLGSAACCFPPASPAFAAKPGKQKKSSTESSEP